MRLAVADMLAALDRVHAGIKAGPNPTKTYREARIGLDVTPGRGVLLASTFVGAIGYGAPLSCAVDLRTLREWLRAVERDRRRRFGPAVELQVGEQQHGYPVAKKDHGPGGWQRPKIKWVVEYSTTGLTLYALDNIGRTSRLHLVAHPLTEEQAAARALEMLA
jgi:hypothetical protein